MSVHVEIFFKSLMAITPKETKSNNIKENVNLYINIAGKNVTKKIKCQRVII